jgi:hypothetical protein
LTIYVDRGAGRHKVMEWRGGDITGLLPYSRAGRTSRQRRAEEPTELITVHRNDFPEMIRQCTTERHAVHLMVDRARIYFQLSARRKHRCRSANSPAVGARTEQSGRGDRPERRVL